MENSNKRKTLKRQAGSIVRRCLMLLFGVKFTDGAFISARVLLERRSAANAYEVLRLEAQPSVVTVNKVPPAADSDKQEEKAGEAADAEPVPRVSMDFAPLQELCPNIKGWLFAEGTNVDYPVVQTDNNDYYLTHLYNGEANASGALFLDYRNNDLFMDRNTVIYGHHMMNGSMFGSLNLYKEQDFYDEYPTMLLYTPDGDYLVELICGTVEDGNYEFVRFNFDDEDDFCSYIESRRSRSTFRSNVEIGPEDRIISLCTCSYEWNNARYMIMGKLTPIMEDPTR